MRNAIEGYDILSKPLPSDAAYASTDRLFHGINQNKKKAVIKNQQMYDYHMYRNRLPWELNPNPEQSFNGFNKQVSENPYCNSQYRQQDSLQPTYYDTVQSKNYGVLDNESRLPIPLDNNQLFQYTTNSDSQGIPRLIAPITQESRLDYRQRKSDRSYDQVNKTNQTMQDYFFTPTMNGYGHGDGNGGTANGY